MQTRRQTHADPIDNARDKADQMEADANANSRAPLEFELMWLSSGKVQCERFTATSATRAQEMRQRGVSPDNTQWALKSRTQRGDWGAPIGNDERLKAELRRRR